MNNLTFMEIENERGEKQTHVIIDHGNGEFTSMHKSEYDRRQAEQSTPILPA